MSYQDIHTFKQLRRQLEMTSAHLEQRALIDAFLSKVERVPLVADKQAVLLYRGRARQTVRVLGDWNGYREPGQPLTEIAASGLYYLPLRVDSAARLDYIFSVGSPPRFRLDPLNPRRIGGGFGPRSVLAMPAYRPAPEWEESAPVPAGQTIRFRWQSRALGQRRTIIVYTPPDYPADAPYPAVYLHDGGDYVRFACLPQVADRLIAMHRVRPFVAVCMTPHDRVSEYDCNDAYVSFVTDEVRPAIEQRFAVEPRPERRAIMGASYGGLISLYIALRRPDVFGCVGGQSAYASRRDGFIIRAYSASPCLPLRLHLIVGAFERHLDVEDDESNFLHANRRLAAVLRKRGYEVSYAEYPEGHSWGLWRNHIGDALEYFWGVEGER